MNRPPRVAWLSAETPDRLGGGGQRRQFHQIRVLVEQGIEVRAATLRSAQSDVSLRELVPVERFHARRRFRGGVGLDSLRDVDAAIVAHVDSLPHFERSLRRLEIPFALDFHNVYSRWHEARSEPREAARWREKEQHALVAASHSFACSEEEAHALRELAPSAPVDVAGNGIAVDEWPETLHERKRIVAMFGTWSHEPNREALRWLGCGVWPQVLADVPDARLLLFGPGEPPSIPAVERCGRVESLADALGRVRVVAVPIRRGMGARVKFGEALASGAAVVSTAVGAEGFDETGAHRYAGSYLCADSADEFAIACVRLLSDAEYARAVGLAGRALAFRRFTWEETTKPLARWLASVAEATDATDSASHDTR